MLEQVEFDRRNFARSPEYERFICHVRINPGDLAVFSADTGMRGGRRGGGGGTSSAPLFSMVIVLVSSSPRVTPCRGANSTTGSGMRISTYRNHQPNAQPWPLVLGLAQPYANKPCLAMRSVGRRRGGPATFLVRQCSGTWIMPVSASSGMLVMMSSLTLGSKVTCRSQLMPALRSPGGTPRGVSPGASYRGILIHGLNEKLRNHYRLSPPCNLAFSFIIAYSNI